MAFRKRIWIDPSVQGVLVGRILIYWTAAILYFSIAVGLSHYFENPQWSFSQLAHAWLETVGPWIPSAVLMMPLVVYDVIRLSHQFVGPVHRAKNQLRRIAQSPNCTPFVLRTDDYWSELIEPINNVQNHILSLHGALHRATMALVNNNSPAAGDVETDVQSSETTADNPSRSKVACLDVANFQVIEETNAAS